MRVAWTEWVVQGRIVAGGIRIWGLRRQEWFGPTLAELRPDPSVWVAETPPRWSIEQDHLCEGRTRTPLSLRLDPSRVVEVADGLVVATDDLVAHVDPAGVVRVLARYRASTGTVSVEVSGDTVVWAESAGDTDRIRACHVRGGDPVTLVEAPLLRVLHARDGRVLAAEGAWIRPDPTFPAKRAWDQRALIVADLPPVARGEVPVGPSRLDPVGVLPISPEVAAELAQRGFVRVVDVRRDGLSARARLEVDYGLFAHDRWMAGRERTTSLVHPRWLAPVRSVVPPAVAAKLERKQIALVGQLVVLTEASLLKTDGIGRGTLGRIRDAVAQHGLALGIQWADLGS